ncbi:DNA topoisomerase IB [Arthrobacter ginkgonis]|uniref:DNA topoisomerase n=1 Tax=Arthrobacter ginkgonis TaxID=1630594 RepID=A0ABP7C7I0_9MICC
MQVKPGRGGIRRDSGKDGFEYRTSTGRLIRAAATLRRIDLLAIPPAWEQVWIASSPGAHVQATGEDAAGRTQYIYHPLWREARDVEKFARAQAFAERLPQLRRAVTRDLGSDSSPRRAVAAAVRLIDQAGLRVGAEDYARKNGSFGATTLRRRHVRVEEDEVLLDFPGKSGQRWEIRLRDPLLASYLASLPRRPATAPALCRPVRGGRRIRWQAPTPGEVNAYIAQAAGQGFTAKDFRTWQGTVTAALTLSEASQKGTDLAAAVTAAVRATAERLHNTPAVARSAYIDPRVIELFEQGRVADRALQPDRAVLQLLD